MKNYNLLFNKGIKYNVLAFKNWDIRRSKLQAQYIHPKNAFKVSRLQKIMRLIGEIDERADHVGRFLRWASAKRLQSHLQALQSTVTLVCSSPGCQSRTNLQRFVVPLKSYVPGKKLCNLCNQPLVTEDDIAIDKMLAELGIRIIE